MANRDMRRVKPRIDGLGGLLPSAFEVAPSAVQDEMNVAGEPRLIAIEQLREDPENARRHFDEEALNELADTIREHGVLEPLLAVQLAENQYQIRSGARRYRAAIIAGVEQVPVWVIKDITSLAAIVVNLQRETLHPVEVGIALAEIASKENLSSQQLAAAIGRSKTWVSRYLSMSRLSDEDKRFLRALNSSDATLLSDVSKVLKTNRAAVTALADAGSLDRPSVTALLASAAQELPAPSATPDGANSHQSQSSKRPQDIQRDDRPGLVIEHEGAEWLLDWTNNGGEGRYEIESIDDPSVRAKVAMPIKLLRIQGS